MLRQRIPDPAGRLLHVRVTGQLDRHGVAGSLGLEQPLQRRRRENTDKIFHGARARVCVCVCVFATASSVPAYCFARSASQTWHLQHRSPGTRYNGTSALQVPIPSRQARVQAVVSQHRVRMSGCHATNPLWGVLAAPRWNESSVIQKITYVTSDTYSHYLAKERNAP